MIIFYCESDAEPDAVIDRYVEAFDGLNYSREQAETEMLCDAYAGMNAFEAGADEFYSPVRETVEDFAESGGLESITKDGRQYSISETDDGRVVAVIDDDILSHIETANWNDTKKAQAKKAAKTALLAFKDGVQVNGIIYKVNKVSRDEFTRSNDTERLYRKEPKIFADKLRTSANADDIITATTSWANDGKLTHPRTDNLVDFAHGEVLIQAGTNQYEAETVVGITDAGEHIFYDVVDMEPTSFKVKEEPSTAATGKDAESAIQESSSGDSIAENSDPVKNNLSDSELTYNSRIDPDTVETDGSLRLEAPTNTQTDLSFTDNLSAKEESFRRGTVTMMTNAINDALNLPSNANVKSGRKLASEIVDRFVNDGSFTLEFMTQGSNLGRAKESRIVTIVVRGLIVLQEQNERSGPWSYVHQQKIPSTVGRWGILTETLGLEPWPR